MGEDNWIIVIVTVLTVMLLHILFIPVWVILSVLKGLSMGLTGGIEMLKGYLGDMLKDV